METNVIKILVSAGGTGGHLFPAIAVIEEIENILKNKYQLEIFAIGKQNKIEAKKSYEKGWHFIPIPMEGFSGFGLKFFDFFVKTIKSVNIVRNLIRKENIDFGIGTGAYITYPAGIALYSEKKPFFLLESNLVPGRANRLLARKSSIFFATFENTIKYLPPNIETKFKVYGTPIRKDLLSQIPKEQARKKLGLDPEKNTILIFGGSLGAKSINDVVFSNYKKLLASGFQIIWQVGKNFDVDIVNQKGLIIFEFIDDMATAYAAADLVVSRSGASTIAEISALGKPAILIPYPFATGKHQELNAMELHTNEAAILVHDNEAKEKLIPKIFELFENQEMLTKLAMNIKKFYKPNSCERIAKEILKFLNI
ncbi:MAG: undecaprenyldiphospho-muramoylpentapeptide beta-N-acetylglucosaminyltransferase [Ignavibacteria bacterium]|nr:undecaprenyldiphospho-muramoylpentapeptide beta-N-acetylglucosaminyltransferase [Ignavibacteria bacterium]